MASSFDTAAATYDDTFTHSVIGKIQRQYVHLHLTNILNEKKPKKILEINCGTGEDAIWLAKQNYKVTATDISKKMIVVAKEKGDFDNLHFIEADINELSKHFNKEEFDMIFSNFGGLNCLSQQQLEEFFKNCAPLLSKTGTLVLVIMPRNTLWEQFYFLSKGNFKDIFRRKKRNLIANVDGENVTTYYYNPEEASQLANSSFNLKNKFPIGLFVPPSYLEPFFKNKPRLISILSTLETKVQQYQSLSKYADHYLIVFEKR